MSDWVGLTARLQISFGQVQCTELEILDEWPTKQPYRTFYAVIVSGAGNDAMRNLKFEILRNFKDLIPYIKNWNAYPPIIRV